tara:strand:- start:279 stop:1226 length:948 start_codon:yes stop_codon:yes gene_type:complete
MKNEFCIRKYTPEDFQDWNSFVEKSLNGTFLHNRNFMEYHSDRFEDHSMIIENEKKILTVLPANKSENELQSHAGLTYGGFIVDSTMTATLMLNIFENLKKILLEMGINKFLYKAIPHIFQQHPVEQDLYAIHKNGGQLIRSDLSSVINIKYPLQPSKSKKQGIKRAQSVQLKVHESIKFTNFWIILEDRLKHAHRERPTHTLKEIEGLREKFPNNIRLFLAKKDHKIQAGVLVFDCGITAHVQYISSTNEGRQNGAIDLIISHLLQNVFYDRRWFDFGISTSDKGTNLNDGLVRSKEMFGARSVVFNHYYWKLS